MYYVTKTSYFCDVARTSISVQNKIINRLSQLLPGSILFVQDFASEGSDVAVRQALTRLVQQGLLRRLAQGIYTIPKKIGNHGFILPDPDEIAAAVAKRDKIRIIPTGEMSLYRFGLSEQVPLKYVYLTDGPSREIKVEEKEGENSYTITFKRAAPKNFSMRGRISSQVIQAMKALGEKNITDAIMDKIESFIMRENLDDLEHDLQQAPAWITRRIRNSFNVYKNEKLDKKTRSRKT